MTGRIAVHRRPDRRERHRLGRREVIIEVVQGMMIVGLRGTMIGGMMTDDMMIGGVDGTMTGGTTIGGGIGGRHWFVNDETLPWLKQSDLLAFL